MKITYVSLSYVPSRRASSVHVMRMCAALARAGHQVELLAKPARDEAAPDDHAFYGVAPTFAITKLPRPRWRGGGVVFAAAMTRALVARRSRVDLVYSRELFGALLAAELGIPFVFESHGVPQERLNRAMLRRLVQHDALRGLVVISDALRRDLVDEGLVPRHRPIVVAHDAADPPAAAPAARPSPEGPPRIGYVGGLYQGRGIELVLEVARRLPAMQFELVGGSPSEVSAWQARRPPGNVVFVGFVPPAQVHERASRFDVLLMPYERTGVGGPSGGDTSRWASPMKMFEYMATGTPIVSSDLPVLGEVLVHERNALIAPAGDAEAWARAIQRLCDDRSLARSLAARAYDDLIRHHTWDARVATIGRDLGFASGADGATSARAFS